MHQHRLAGQQAQGLGAAGTQAYAAAGSGNERGDGHLEEYPQRPPVTSGSNWPPAGVPGASHEQVRGSAGEHLVEQGLGLVLVGALRECELGHED